MARARVCFVFPLSLSFCLSFRNQPGDAQPAFDAFLSRLIAHLSSQPLGLRFSRTRDTYTLTPHRSFSNNTVSRLYMFLAIDRSNLHMHAQLIDIPRERASAFAYCASVAIAQHLEVGSWSSLTLFERGQRASCMRK